MGVGWVGKIEEQGADLDGLPASGAGGDAQPAESPQLAEGVGTGAGSKERPQTWMPNLRAWLLPSRGGLRGWLRSGQSPPMILQRPHFSGGHGSRDSSQEWVEGVQPPLPADPMKTGPPRPVTGQGLVMSGSLSHWGAPTPWALTGAGAGGIGELIV